MYEKSIWIASRKRGPNSKLPYLLNDYTGKGLNDKGFGKKSCFEMFFCTIIICTLLFASGITIIESYNKYMIVPLMNMFDEHPSFVSDIPFPAITLCPTTKFNNEQFDFAKIFLDAIEGGNRVAVEK